MTTYELTGKYKQRLLDLYTAPELCDVLCISAEELLVTFEEKVVAYINEQMDEGDDKLDEQDPERPNEVDGDE